ncbi:hypothetical protein G9A89_015657 [Geosiphon pyriformis]|nr:hypothetical protein G9A89_015657 [Geosiphon pyriformis]
MSTWKQPPAQNPAESASPLMEGTAILQPIGSNDKGKQPALAPKEHLNMQTPIFLNVTSNIPPINQIMAYRDIVKLEKFSGIILQRTSTNNTKPKVVESEIIGTNYLRFAKFLFQQYSQQLGLNNNHYPAESAFNFYVNERITDFLGRPVDIESARKNFYSELIQHTNLSRNYSFAPIIRKINQEIERYTQKTFPITYQNKGKGKLQTPAITPKEIQIPNWKKQRIEFLIYSLYHHTPESTINITLADASTSTKTPLARITFQSKQKKNELLEAYSNYFEGFKSRSLTPSGFQLLPHQPDFGTVSPWEITESEEKKDEDQKFNYQNPILEDPNIQTQQHLKNSEIETLNI